MSWLTVSRMSAIRHLSRKKDACCMAHSVQLAKRRCEVLCAFVWALLSSALMLAMEM